MGSLPLLAYLLLPDCFFPNQKVVAFLSGCISMLSWYSCCCCYFVSWCVDWMQCLGEALADWEPRAASGSLVLAVECHFCREATCSCWTTCLESSPVHCHKPGVPYAAHVGFELWTETYRLALNIQSPPSFFLPSMILPLNIPLDDKFEFSSSSQGSPGLKSNTGNSLIS